MFGQINGYRAGSGEESERGVEDAMRDVGESQDV
jgi:hypothetical protein